MGVAPWYQDRALSRYRHSDSLGRMSFHCFSSTSKRIMTAETEWWQSYLHPCRLKRDACLKRSWGWSLAWCMQVFHPMVAEVHGPQELWVQQQGSGLAPATAWHQSVRGSCSMSLSIKCCQEEVKGYLGELGWCFWSWEDTFQKACWYFSPSAPRSRARWG